MTSPKTRLVDGQRYMLEPQNGCDGCAFAEEECPMHTPEFDCSASEVRNGERVSQIYKLYDLRAAILHARSQA